MTVDRVRRFRLGAQVTVDGLDRDPHPLLARLRASEPVSWIPALDGWLVTRHDLATRAMRDAVTFTVDDPRFSTAQVVGPSMLSLDGEAHARHRAPFAPVFRPRAVNERFHTRVAARARALVEELQPAGRAELRREFAGPLAAAIVTYALGLADDEVGEVLSWYDAIVAAVTSITAGTGATADGHRAFESLSDRLTRALGSPRGDSLVTAIGERTSLSGHELVSNAAVILFGGIETTEGMIANAALHLLQQPQALERVQNEPQLLARAIEESLRLEPAAAVIDRYATSDTELGGAAIRRGELVRISIAAANRDPAVFADPDRFDLDRRESRRHLAFARGPHVCLGVHLARLEAQLGLAIMIERLDRLRLDPGHPPIVHGLVFRKPHALHVLWGQGRTDPAVPA